LGVVILLVRAVWKIDSAASNENHVHAFDIRPSTCPT
jgi:hypothetical protein